MSGPSVAWRDRIFVTFRPRMHSGQHVIYDRCVFLTWSRAPIALRFDDRCSGEIRFCHFNTRLTFWQCAWAVLSRRYRNKLAKEAEARA